MHKLRVLVVASTLGNPMANSWVYGFKSLGYTVAVLGFPATQEQLERWGFRNDILVFSFQNGISHEVRQAILAALGGDPDILFGFWGSQILEPLYRTYQSFPLAQVVLCIDTLPNASNILTELMEGWRFRNTDLWISGYVFYSEAMRRFFGQRVPSSRSKSYLAMIMPFLKKAFASCRVVDPRVPRLARFDERPHVIFTGRGDRLWSKDLGSARDAVGSFLARLAKHDVHVFVHKSADLKEIANLHPYPDFSNADLFEGRFAQYISQFDAHLVIYNEYNRTIRRRVSTSLSTRLAFALTSTCPVAVTRTSQFIEEYWKDTPFGFAFSNVEELADVLYDRERLASLRCNMEKVHASYSLEAQSQRITQFLEDLLNKTEISS